MKSRERTKGSRWDQAAVRPVAGGYGHRHRVADEQEGYFDAVFKYAQIFPERSSETWFFWYKRVRFIRC